MPNDFYTRIKFQWPYRLKFRKSHNRVYLPVRGGRWFIRKAPIEYAQRDGRRWRAWSRGNASIYSHWFHTHDEAIEWAAYVSHCFAHGVKPERHDVYKVGLVMHNHAIALKKELESYTWPK